MNYFTGCTTVAEVKAMFRRLMLEHHPDRHPEERRPEQNRIAAAIIDAYHKILARLDGQTSKDEQGQEHTYRYNRQNEQAIIDKITDLLKITGLLEAAELWLIGTWVWVIGDTRPYSQQLKEHGLNWHGKRRAWYWKPYAHRSHYNKTIDLNGLAAYYGARQFTQAEEEAPRQKKDNHQPAAIR